MNTFLSAFYTSHTQLQVTDLLVRYAQFILTTDMVGTVIPQILWRYGANVPVGIMLEAVETAPVVRLTEAKGTASANVRVTLTVNGEHALVATFKGIVLGGNLNVSGGCLHGEMDNPTADMIVVEETTLKDVTEKVLANELEMFVVDQVTQLNELLSSGLKLPTVYHLNFEDAQISIHDKYV